MMRSMESLFTIANTVHPPVRGFNEIFPDNISNPPFPSLFNFCNEAVSQATKFM